MQRVGQVFVCAVIVALAAPARADTPATAPDQSKSEAARGPAVQRAIDDAKKPGERRTKLDKGEIVVDLVAVAGFNTQAAVMSGVVEAPPAETWKPIEFCKEYSRFLPRISESEELSRVDGVIRCRTKLDSPWPVADMVGVTQARHVVSEGRFTREWRMESGDYHYIVGSWTLVPFDDAGKRTLVIYFIHSEPKSGIPGALREMAQKNSLPDALRAIRQEVARRRE